MERKVITTKFTVVGASTRALVESLRRSNSEFQIDSIDFFADADLERYANRIVCAENYAQFAGLIQQDCNGLLFTGGVENDAACLSEIAKQSPLLATRVDAIEKIRNPKLLQNFLLKNGFNSPRQLHSRLDVEAQEIQEIDWIEKPFASAGGRGIRRIAELDRGSESLESSDYGAVYLQEFVAGISMSACFCAIPDKVIFLGCTEQLSPEKVMCGNEISEFAYCGSSGPIELAQVLENELHRIVNCMVNEFQLIGLFGVDFILADQELWVLEVNPRYVASMEVLELAFQFESLSFHLASFPELEPTLKNQLRGDRLTQAMDELVESQKEIGSRRITKAIFYNESGGDVVVEKTWFDRAMRIAKKPWFPDQTWVRDIPAANSLIPASAPAFTWIQCGSKEQAINNGKAFAAELGLLKDTG